MRKHMHNFLLMISCRQAIRDEAEHTKADQQKEQRDKLKHARTQHTVRDAERQAEAEAKAKAAKAQSRRRPAPSATADTADPTGPTTTARDPATDPERPTRPTPNASGRCVDLMGAEWDADKALLKFYEQMGNDWFAEAEQLDFMDPDNLTDAQQDVLKRMETLIREQIVTPSDHVRMVTEAQLLSVTRTIKSCAFCGTRELGGTYHDNVPLIAQTGMALTDAEIKEYNKLATLNAEGDVVPGTIDYRPLASVWVRPQVRAPGHVLSVVQAMLEADEEEEVHRGKQPRQRHSKPRGDAGHTHFWVHYEHVRPDPDPKEAANNMHVVTLCDQCNKHCKEYVDARPPLSVAPRKPVLKPAPNLSPAERAAEKLEFERRIQECFRARLDFGNPERLRKIGLGSLSLVEKYLIARVRTYASVVQLVPPPRNDRYYNRHRKMRGHIISFLHSGPEAIVEAMRSKPKSTFPNTEHITRFIKVVFLGPKDGPDSIPIGRLHSLPQLQVDFDKVIRWLKMLKAVGNPMYADIEIDESDVARAAVNALPAQVVRGDNVYCVDDDNLVRYHRRTQDNVAVVRNTGLEDATDDEDEEPAVNTTRGADASEPAEAPLPPIDGDAQPTFEFPDDMSHVLIDHDSDHSPLLPAGHRIHDMAKLFVAEQRSAGKKTKANSATATLAAATIARAAGAGATHVPNPPADADGEAEMDIDARGPDVDAMATDSHDEHDKVVPARPRAPATQLMEGEIRAVRTTDTPVDEFHDNNQLYAGAFPWVFPWGAGGLPKGSLPINFRKLLLRQYSLGAAKEPWVYFLGMNQLQRHMVLKASAALINHPRALREFEKVKDDPDLANKFVQAKADPDGKVARALSRKIEPLLRNVGSKVPYSPQERSAGISRMYALCHTYGPPTSFFTTSMDDVHNTLTLRLSHPALSSDPTQFPNSPEALLAALKDGANSMTAPNEVVIPLDECGLDRNAMSNPVACAEVFAAMMDTVYSVLLGVDKAQSDGAHGETKTSRPLCERKRGMFGQTRCVFSVIEVQGRYGLRITTTCRTIISLC